MKIPKKQTHPYDTGEVAQPHIWDGLYAPQQPPREALGRVDFDDDESRTVATVRVVRKAGGGHQVVVESGDDVEIEHVVE